MKKSFSLLAVAFAVLAVFPVSAQETPAAGSFILASKNLGLYRGNLKFDGFFFETEKGRVNIPLQFGEISQRAGKEVKMPDGRIVNLSVKAEGGNFQIHFTARPAADILKWGLAID